MPSASLLKALRVLHLYVGVFIAPAVLFFAFSGALQTFGLHETNRDHPDYKPAKWEVVLAQIHKKQTFIVPARRPPAAPKAQSQATPAQPAEPEHPHRAKSDSSPEHPAAPVTDTSLPPAASPAAKPAIAGPDQAPKHNPLPLRIFFLLVTIGLFTSTLTGIYMSYKYNRNRVLVTLTLLAGIVIPPLLLLA
jgi:hypothetical protein